MKKSTLGALLLLIIGAGVVVLWKLALPLILQKEQIDSSDAANARGTVRIGGDNYLGYWFVTSPAMRKSASRDGISLKFNDDGGAYAERLKKFANGDYDAIVLPVNSYLQHGAAVNYPGVIVAAICESQGADGIVGFSDKLPTGKIKDLDDPNLSLVYTSESPSSFLLDLTIADFDLANLKAGTGWRNEVGSSREVFEKARKQEGDVFVLWEPDLSRALRLDGMSYVWGSDKFSGYILDVFVFHRDFLENKPQLAKDFMKHYFRTLALYTNDRPRMLKEMKRSTDLNQEELEGIVKKIEWFNLNENCQDLFGISLRPDRPANDGMISTIIANTDVLIRMEHFQNDPLSGNPYLLTQSNLLEDLLKNGGPMSMAGSGSKAVTFDPLSDAEWDRLSDIGEFRVEPITFQTWDNRLTPEGKATVDRIAKMLVHNYPGYRIVIRGHTAPGGDEEENRKLSLERAQAVMQYLKAVHNIEGVRMRAIGMGSTMPPERKPGESTRAFRYRQSRVAFVAVEGNKL